MRLYKADGTAVDLQEIENSDVIYLNDIVKYEIHNGVCYVNIYNGDVLYVEPNKYITIGILPVAPRTKYDFVIHFIGGSPISQSCHITTSGEIKIYIGVGENNNYFAGSFCFPIS